MLPKQSLFDNTFVRAPISTSAVAEDTDLIERAMLPTPTFRPSNHHRRQATIEGNDLVARMIFQQPSCIFVSAPIGRSIYPSERPS
ncbi:MAG: hypothetical protein H6822_18585 [Planctomycetaceae bacterium]|nr:hypothetical protein [Planctomycetales bacterium]MCB9924195.1 hypothetical protein [Planctomycetaceae bacterium]